MTDQPAVSVSRDDTGSRYQATLDGAPAGFIDFKLRGDRVALIHTETDPAFAGRGVGTALAVAALEDLRARGLKANVYCPFIKNYLARHPGQYDDVVAEIA